MLTKGWYIYCHSCMGVNSKCVGLMFLLKIKETSWDGGNYLVLLSGTWKWKVVSLTDQPCSFIILTLLEILRTSRWTCLAGKETLFNSHSSSYAEPWSPHRAMVWLLQQAEQLWGCLVAVLVELHFLPPYSHFHTCMVCEISFSPVSWMVESGN